MSDSREAFEQLHAIPSGAIWCENRDVYIHKNYSGLVLHPINESWEAFCEGALWQASRQEGEPIGFLQSSGVSQLSGGHPAKLYPIGATPSPFESSTLVYTHPASSDEWIKCTERLPKESDGDCHGIVWVYNKGLSWVEISDLEDVKFISDYTHWMPTNLVRPEPPKQEEGQ